nr:reverse transcriptase domain-containing protein [Tanacetum cinerariifolium]
MPFELMCDANEFAIGAVLGQHQEKHFRPIYNASKTMTEAESNYTTKEKEMLAVVYAFEKFRSYFIMNKSIVYTDHSALKYLFAKKDYEASLLRWVLLLQEFTFKVIDTKRAENLAADHLSRLENPHQNVLDPKETNESFPLETLNLVSSRGGTFMKRHPEECYDLIENITAHHNDWDTSAQRSESSISITSSFDTEIVALKVEMAEINKNLMRVLHVNQQVKAVTPNYETCGGLHSFNDCPAIEESKGIITRNGTAYQGPMIPTTSSSLPSVVERETEATKDTVHPTNNGSTKYVQPLVVQTESPILNSEPVIAPIIEPVVAPVSASKPNKDKLSELARTSLNEHCLAVLLKKLPEKLGDPDKFLIPCDFPKLAECLALADLGASINLMPLSVWNKLSLPDLSPTCMTLELAYHLISHPVGVAEDVFIKVGTFHFPTDFVVIDFDVNPQVPLILRRSFLKTKRALIDVFEGELTLRVGKEAITFNFDQTSRYSANYNDMTAKRIDVIDMACEDYSQEVLGFSDVIASSNPTPYYDPIVSTTSPTLTSFGESDFLLEEVNAFLALEDDPTSLEVDHSYVDTEGDILLLEAFLNDDPSLPSPNQGNYLPQV